jgi:tyrosyl-tRNA synthetase
MLADSTEGASQLFRSGEMVTGYIGFDPTAASLHVGSLLVVMSLVHLQRAGHRPIAIVGGGTGMIGDPSGKSQERQLLSAEVIEQNLLGIRSQLERFLDFNAKKNPATIINNADWLGELKLLEFLRDTGKYFSVGNMLSKESVRRRVSESGMSFTEFSYMLLQAYDFLVLFDRYGCKLQMGGTDQLGNIIAGMDLIRRLRGKDAFGIVHPLVTSSSGVKFGKTEQGTVWLDPALTSPFRFYQFWLNTDDKDVIQYLKFFTLLTESEISELAAATRDSPKSRAAHRKLAEEVTRTVHGDSGLSAAERATSVLFGQEFSGLDAPTLLDIFQDVPSVELPRAKLDEGLQVTSLAVSAGLAKGTGDARRLIEGGGLYLNNRRVEQAADIVTLSSAIDGKVVVLRRGAREYRVIQLVK